MFLLSTLIDGFHGQNQVIKSFLFDYLYYIHALEGHVHCFHSRFYIELNSAAILVQTTMLR